MNLLAPFGGYRQSGNGREAVLTRRSGSARIGSHATPIDYIGHLTEVSCHIRLL
ncbi:MAG: hypothetical protein JWR58_2625 [Pseudonocardia sp.]|nr:hypothetical protein [Pseudonocardia sp.]